MVQSLSVTQLVPSQVEAGCSVLCQGFHALGKASSWWGLGAGPSQDSMTTVGCLGLTPGAAWQAEGRQGGKGLGIPPPTPQAASPPPPFFNLFIGK